MNKRQNTALGIIIAIVFGLGYCMGFSFNNAEAITGAILMGISLLSAVVFGIVNVYMEHAKKKRQNKKQD